MKGGMKMDRRKEKTERNDKMKEGRKDRQREWDDGNKERNKGWKMSLKN